MILTHTKKEKVNFWIMATFDKNELTKSKLWQCQTLSTAYKETGLKSSKLLIMKNVSSNDGTGIYYSPGTLKRCYSRLY